MDGAAGVSGGGLSGGADGPGAAGGAGVAGGLDSEEAPGPIWGDSSTVPVSASAPSAPELGSDMVRAPAKELQRPKRLTRTL